MSSPPPPPLTTSSFYRPILVPSPQATHVQPQHGQPQPFLFQQGGVPVLQRQLYEALHINLNQQRSMLSLHYRRWSNWHAELHGNISEFAFLVQIIILVGLAINSVPRWDRTSKNIFCTFTSALILRFTFRLHNWTNKIKFATIQLIENGRRKTQLLQIWSVLQQQGVVDPFMEDWFLFLNEPILLNLTMLTFIYLIDLLLWAVYLFTCWHKD